MKIPISRTPPILFHVFVILLISLDYIMDENFSLFSEISRISISIFVLSANIIICDRNSGHPLFIYTYLFSLYTISNTVLSMIIPGHLEHSEHTIWGLLRLSAE